MHIPSFFHCIKSHPPISQSGTPRGGGRRPQAHGPGFLGFWPWIEGEIHIHTNIHRYSIHTTIHSSVPCPCACIPCPCACIPHPCACIPLSVSSDSTLWRVRRIIEPWVGWCRTGRQACWMRDLGPGWEGKHGIAAQSCANRVESEGSSRWMYIVGEPCSWIGKLNQGRRFSFG